MIERLELQQQQDLAEKLSTIGLTPDEYSHAIRALVLEDYEALDILNRKTESTIRAASAQEQLTHSRNGVSPDSQRLHEAIINGILDPVEVYDNPTFTIFAGPPGVGKTTAQKVLIEQGGQVVTDPTLIQKKLRENFDESDYAQILETNEEAFEVAEKLIDRAFDRGLSIISESTLQNIPWAQKSITEALGRGYKVNIVFIHKPWYQCFQDAIEKRERPISLNYLFKSAKGYKNLIHFDQIPGVNVTVIDKRNNVDHRVVYDSDQGVLHEMDEFVNLNRKAETLSGLVIN